jgi:hypothetical protein
MKQGLCHVGFERRHVGHEPGGNNMGTSCTLNLVLKQGYASLSVSGRNNSRQVPGHHRGMGTCQGKFVRTNKVLRPHAWEYPVYPSLPWPCMFIWHGAC